MSDKKPFWTHNPNLNYKSVFAGWRACVALPPYPLGASRNFAHAAEVQRRRENMRLLTLDGVNVEER